MSMTIKSFGEIDCTDISLVTITLESGFSASFCQFGATIVSINAPDKYGKFADVVQGYDDANGYSTGFSSHGSVVGRYANRIAKGEFFIDDEKIKLLINCPPHTLHGGNIGFHRAVWDIVNTDENSVTFSYKSADCEAGFPGNLTAYVKYTVEDDSVRLDYKAISDKKTAVNLTNHAYFNLSGMHDKLIDSHIMWIDADRITAVDELNVPTGDFVVVDETIFDFRKAKSIFENSYDHNFVLNGFSDITNKNIFKAASLFEPDSGRVMHCFTNKPGLQIYTANGLSEVGKNGVFMPKRSSVCLETQYFPDSPNHEEFPFEFLEVGDEYCFSTLYKFEVGDSL